MTTPYYIYNTILGRTFPGPLTRKQGEQAVRLTIENGINEKFGKSKWSPLHQLAERLKDSPCPSPIEYAAEQSAPPVELVPDAETDGVTDLKVK